MSNVDKLFAKMRSEGLTLGGMTLGPKATPEAVAGEILRSLEEIENGNSEAMDTIGD